METITEIFAHYRHYLARMGKQSTRDDYGKRLSMLERFASMNGITDAEDLDFVAYLDWVYIERGVSPCTHNNYRTWCRSFCKWMLHQHIITIDPMGDIDTKAHGIYINADISKNGKAEMVGLNRTLGIVYNSNNNGYYTGGINASIARNTNIVNYENAKINAIAPSQAAFNIHQIAINIPCASTAMQDAITNKTLGLFSGSIVSKTTCSAQQDIWQCRRQCHADNTNP